MRRPHVFLLAMVALVPLPAAASARVAVTMPGGVTNTQRSDSTGDDIVRIMHDRYAGTRFRTLTFVQKTERPDRDTETWYEALSPGRLRIDIAPLDSMNAVIFRDDSLYVFRSGTAVQARPFFHPLLLLLDDVYFMEPTESARMLREHGFDLDRLHRDEWRGHPVYVVGAAEGDTVSNQFWVDADRLITLRVIQKSGEDGSHRDDTWIGGHRSIGGGWAETEVLFHRDGELLQRESYSDLHAGVELDPGLYDVDAYRPPTWLKK